MARSSWAGQVDIVGVAWNGTDAAMQDFVDRHGLTFTNLRDATGDVFARFGVPYQPAWAFVSADGNVELHLGALSDERLSEQLAALAS